MTSIKQIFLASSLLIFCAGITACNKPQQAQEPPPTASSYTSEAHQAKPNFPNNTNTMASSASPTLPIRYQTPSFMLDSGGAEDLARVQEATSIKVGASIRSTRGPQPLWDILKRLAALKRMNVSWASDVDQNVLVDVDISANDDFYDSIDNLLRQVDYFHELQGNTIIVKYKETRRFHVAMPFVSQNYQTGTGGNLLGSDEGSNNIDGTITLKSNAITFDLWSNIEENVNEILSVWSTEAVTQTNSTQTGNNQSQTEIDNGEDEVGAATRRRSGNQNSFIIDKSIGMVTATAPRPLLNRLDDYFKTLQNELYKQITIEAKIIEVELSSGRQLGIDWTEVLSGFNVSGTVTFGDNGIVYPTSEKFVSQVSIDPSNFTAFIRALDTQGSAKILSNPKISVMNGQPALISVGRNITYIDNIESDVDTDNGVITYTVNTERILSGLGMALTATVLNDNQIIMNLVPVTSELVRPIEETQVEVGNDGAIVNLPEVNVREISTTVKVENGEMLVIGGLISNFDENTDEFAPGLGDIPVLKYLFGHEEKTSLKRELIILLRPQII